MPQGVKFMPQGVNFTPRGVNFTPLISKSIDGKKCTCGKALFKFLLLYYGGNVVLPITIALLYYYGENLVTVH